MRLDMGIRASALVDRRTAAFDKGEPTQQLYDKLSRYAL